MGSTYKTSFKPRESAQTKVCQIPLCHPGSQHPWVNPFSSAHRNDLLGLLHTSGTLPKPSAAEIPALTAAQASIPARAEESAWSEGAGKALEEEWECPELEGPSSPAAGSAQDSPQPTCASRAALPCAAHRHCSIPDSFGGERAVQTGRALKLLFSPRTPPSLWKKPWSPARGAQTNIGHSREGKCQNSGAATQGGKWKGLGGLPRSTSSQRPGTYSSKIQSPSEPASIQSPGNQWLRMGPFHTSSPAEASGGWREGGGSSWGALGVTKLALKGDFFPSKPQDRLVPFIYTHGMVWNAYRLGLYNVTPATNQSRKVLQHIIQVPLKSKKKTKKTLTGITILQEAITNRPYNNYFFFFYRIIMDRVI